MRIEHLAIWVQDLEKMKTFYSLFFHMKCGEIYINEKKGFSFYFLSFESDASLELIHRSE